MGRMIADGKFLLNDAGDHWTCPNPGGESVGDGTTIQHVREFTPLGLRQFRRSPGPVSFQQPLQPMLAPVAQPQGDFGAVHFEEPGNIRRSLPFHVEHHGVKAVGDPIRTFAQCLFAKLHQLLYLFRCSMKFDRSHGISLMWMMPI